MAETIEKLRPDRDLQCYFERPSAIAALSGAGPAGFTASGTWRQQFDWCVIEWNRDNVFEHPWFRTLPDEDLSALVLTYEETRENCIPVDSDLYPTVDWPYLRVWARSAGQEEFYRVPLRNYATAIEGSYQNATAEFELKGSPATDDYVGLAWLDEHHTHQVYGTDTLETIAEAIVQSVNAFSSIMTAARTGARITLTYTGGGQSRGSNGNRLGAYGHVGGAKTEYWEPSWRQFSGGQSPTKWRVQLDFSNLHDTENRLVPAQAVRKMRWTYAADMQPGAFNRSEFRAVVSNWTVTGANRAYKVAGKGSRRIEDDARAVEYSGAWSSGRGNFSGGTIHWTQSPGAQATITYRSPQIHYLYVGTRLIPAGPQIKVTVDAQPPSTHNLALAGEDVLIRLPIQELGPGEHTVRITHDGAVGEALYFDFIEIAIPHSTVENLPAMPGVTLATDWDTDHSIAVAPERTAWMIHSLGFRGRVNHYVGALWFYELVRPGHQYASATVDFIGTPQPSQTTQLVIGRQGDPPGSENTINHLNLFGDTAETIAKAFELLINNGFTGIRAAASGAQLTIHARMMGEDGNLITISGSPASGDFRLQLSSPTLTGGLNGAWRTDLQASPRLNRAARDWSAAFYTALKALNLDVVAAFSMELQHGDPSTTAGIAQRYPNGEPVLLSTPALQTNFSPTSLNYWKQVHLEMAEILADAGHTPFLQFGEVQWWYFPLTGSGMPFYDTYTLDAFYSQYGRAMRVIPDRTADPSQFAEEAAFLPQLIGQFTSGVMQHVRTQFPNSKFEVLYPTDVNDTALNGRVNYPSTVWTAQNLDNLKTESFTYTFMRNLNLSRATIQYGTTRGFAASKRSFLVGIGDSTTTWRKEVKLAKAQGLESIVLFALDQFSLIGYQLPLVPGTRRSFRTQ